MKKLFLLIGLFVFLISTFASSKEVIFKCDCFHFFGDGCSLPSQKLLIDIEEKFMIIDYQGKDEQILKENNIPNEEGEVVIRSDFFVTDDFILFNIINLETEDRFTWRFDRYTGELLREVLLATDNFMPTPQFKCSKLDKLL